MGGGTPLFSSFLSLPASAPGPKKKSKKIFSRSLEGNCPKCDAKIFWLLDESSAEAASSTKVR